MNHFQRLPVEVLEGMFSKMKPKDVILLSKTCRLFRDVAQNDKVWREVCRREFGVQLPVSKTGFARRFYKNVLHQYGHFLGYWVKETDTRINRPIEEYRINRYLDRYGGLLQIKYSDGQLHGIELQVPKIPQLMDPLRPKKIFTITMDETKDDQLSIKCCSIGPQHQHNCHLQYEEKLLDDRSTPSWYLMRRCSATHSGMVGLEEHDALQQHLVDHLDMHYQGAADFFNRLHLREVFTAAFYGEKESYYTRLLFPSTCQFDVPIQPGIFKGTNGCQGIQLLRLSYTDENTVSGFKITGDGYVPAGEVSFSVDLRHCIYLDHESQSLEQLIVQMEMEPVLSDISWSELPKPQPFVMPQELHYPLVPNVPDQCSARFVAQIRGDYGNDEKGHLIVFNEDIFGIIFSPRFFDDNDCSWTVFHRVQDPSLQVTSPP